jgi:predicted dehydrogenase
VSAPLRLAIVGLGKIAHDQHLPAIAGSERFELVAVASPGASLTGIPVFDDLDQLLASEIPVDAVALCQPPQLRFAAAASAIRGGKHVLLEKPPGTTVSEVETLTALAHRAGTTLFAAWHSRFAPGIRHAREWLTDRQVRSVVIRWHEDVRQWHGGQQWIWNRGGLGVFDPGINALSILTELLAEPLRVVSGTLEVPANRETPIAVELHLRTFSDAPVQAVFDWRSRGTPVWDIEIHTDLEVVTLSRGGAELTSGARDYKLEPEREYRNLYQRFAHLIDAHESEVDVTPLRLVADAFCCCTTRATQPFHD